jgi:hypothetical protein
MTNVGILHEPGHAEPWMIAMNCLPTLTAVLDYRVRWSMEPLFSDFQSRGFKLENSQLQQAGRLERRVLIMALAMHGCVRSGRSEATNCRRYSKKTREQAGSESGISKSYRSLVSWFKRGLRGLMHCLQNDLILPAFYEIVRN